MNCTLVKLGCVMLRGQDLPEFLWEYAIVHAAYLHNRLYMKFLKNITPYQKWNKSKPNVTHLREFGAPVWVLLQGQKVPRKMLAKSQRRAYVGFDDGSKSIMPKHEKYLPHGIIVSFPSQMQPLQKKSWLHTINCMKGSVTTSEE